MSYWGKSHVIWSKASVHVFVFRIFTTGKMPNVACEFSTIAFCSTFHVHRGVILYKRACAHVHVVLPVQMFSWFNSPTDELSSSRGEEVTTRLSPTATVAISSLFPYISGHVLLIATHSGQSLRGLLWLITQ